MDTLRFLLTSTFYPPYHLGGDAVHVQYLADELVRRGHEVHVIHSLDAFRVKRKELPRTPKEESVHIHSIKTRFNYSSYAAYLAGNSSVANNSFESLLKEVRPDVVHHHNVSLLGYGVFKKRGDYVNLYTAHDYWLICAQNNLLRNGKACNTPSCFFCSIKRKKPYQFWRKKKAFKLAVDNIDALICPSAYVGNKISENLNLPVFILPNFVPEPPLNIEAAGFTDFFLYAGVLEPHKGIPVLLNAFKRVSDKSDARLLIAGAGSLRGYIEDFISKNNLSSKIILMGWLNKERLFPLIKDANALLMPSICPENCPMVLLETLSVGTPIITSNEGGLPEIVEKNTGQIYKNEQELENLLSSFNKKDYQSDQIRKRYEDKYSANSYIAKYNRIVIDKASSKQAN